MKSLVKLLILGVVIVLGIRYMNEKDIRVSDCIDGVIEMVHKVLDTTLSPEAESVEEEIREVPERREPQSWVDGRMSAGYRDADPLAGLGPEANTSRVNTPVIEVAIPRRKSTANPRFSELDSFAFKLSSEYRNSLPELTRALVKPARNELEKTRLIFSWIASHISYNDTGFNSGDYGDASAQGVLKSGRAVCEGFGNLFEEMGRLAGLEIVKVNGYAKGITYRPGVSVRQSNHAWNAVKIDGEWKLFDVTWARGFGTVVNGRLVSVNEFDDAWFDVAPEEFIFTHLPKDAGRQLLNPPVSTRLFEQLPRLKTGYFRLGFDAAWYLEKARAGTLGEAPDYSDNDGSVQVVSAPYEKMMRAGRTFRFILSADEREELAVVNSGEWSYFRRDGKYIAEVTPGYGSLKVCRKKHDDSGKWSVLLEYWVE